MADQSTEARLREDIAQITDPKAFAFKDSAHLWPDSTRRWTEALAKADAILALSLPVQDTSDELTRLRAEVEAMRGERDKLLESREAFLADNAALRERIEELGAALKPFADCCDQISAEESDEEWAKFRLLVKDYRLARSLLTKNAED